jgi:ribonuclease HI
VSAPRPHFKFVACDASFDPESGYAALAVCAPGSPLAADIQLCADADEAERRALLLAMDVCASRQWRCVEFRCDARGAVERVLLNRDPDPLTCQLRGRLKKPPRQGQWDLVHVSRSHTHPAHKLAEFTWKAFIQGRLVGDVQPEMAA